MEQVHIFDVDHTIIDGSSGGFFAIRALREGVFSLKVIYRLPLYYLYYRHSSLKQQQMDNGLSEFRNIPRSTFERIAQYSWENSMKKAIYPNIEQLIRTLIDQGQRVILATSSADFIVRPLAEYLGIREIIATELEFDANEMCTGRFNKAFALGEGKLQLVEKLLAEQSVPLGNCSMYSDSIHDLPLLARCGTAYAVNPDRRLRKTAKKEGWYILKAGDTSLSVEQQILQYQ